MKQDDCKAMLARAIASGKAVEDGDCLLWTGSLSKSSGHPKYNDKSLRRVAHQAKHGMLKPAEYVTTTCGNPRCIEHTAQTTRSEISRKQNADPVVKAKKRAKSTAWARANAAKLTEAIAEEIRHSSETCDELAARYGVDRTLPSMIRRGVAWKPANASPFSGLFRRAAC